MSRGSVPVVVACAALFAPSLALAQTAEGEGSAPAAPAAPEGQGATESPAEGSEASPGEPSEPKRSPKESTQAPARPTPPPAVPGAPRTLPHQRPVRAVEAPPPPPPKAIPPKPPPPVPVAPSTQGRKATTSPLAGPPATKPPAATDGADEAAEEVSLGYSHDGTWLVLDASAGLNMHGRLPATETPSSSDDPADILLGASVGLSFDGRLDVGLGYSRIGFGKERYAAATEGTLNVAYDVDAFWLFGRYYFSAERPALYAGIGLGAGLPHARATGAASADPLVVSPEPFECSDAGRLGFGGRLSVGAEVDLSNALAFVSELQGSAHLLDDAVDAHGRCGGAGVAIPGAGPSLQGALNLALAYRLGL